jgi:hypothetical protein
MQRSFARRPAGLAAALVLAVAAVPAAAQHPDAAALLAAQAEAMKALAAMDGVWRGTATALQPDGSRLGFVQTERIGTTLGGSIRVIEGRGYADDGTLRFHAFAVVSYDVARKAYSIHSHAQGRRGDFVFTPTGDGYTWEVPAGPGAVIRYTATIRDGELHEVGDRIVADRPPQRWFEMRLRRLGDTDWPAAGAVPPR